ncbi:MAG TPA: hypothetical protein VGH27_17615 [Streptosporangiaceae bacterium]
MAIEPIAEFTGSLQCWNSFDFREEGGAYWGVVRLWPDRIEMCAQGLLTLTFRTRLIPRERVRFVRPLRRSHWLHRLGSTPGIVNFVVRPPEGAGEIHYVLYPRSAREDAVLAALEAAGYPVSRQARDVTTFSLGAGLAGGE